MLYGIQIFFRGFWVSSRGDAIPGPGEAGLLRFRPQEAGPALAIRGPASRPRPSSRREDASPTLRRPRPQTSRLHPNWKGRGPRPRMPNSPQSQFQTKRPRPLCRDPGRACPIPHRFIFWKVQALPWMNKPSTLNPTPLICMGFSQNFTLGTAASPLGHPRFHSLPSRTSGPGEGGVCMQ